MQDSQKILIFENEPLQKAWAVLLIALKGVLKCTAILGSAPLSKQFMSGIRVWISLEKGGVLMTPEEGASKPDASHGLLSEASGIRLEETNCSDKTILIGRHWINSLNSK
jgi:hypothetical protein